MIPRMTVVGSYVSRPRDAEVASEMLQRSPSPADRSKAADLIAGAAASGAELVVFPESFIPCYPVWL